MSHIHLYKIVKETSQGVVEVCSECKKRLVTKQDKKGRIDNAVYLKEHVRDLAQPNGATGKIFERFYV